MTNSAEEEFEPTSKQEVVLSASTLSRGFRLVVGETELHVRGISPDPRIIENYLRALLLRTDRGTLVVPALLQVYIPHTTIDLQGTLSQGAIALTSKEESKLPSSSLRLLNEGSKEQNFSITELSDVEDYQGASRRMGIEESSFLHTMVQTSQFIFISEWVGPNVPNFLTEEEEERVRLSVGELLGETLATLHAGDLIAGDTHLGQFVVRGHGDEVLRIDLNNIYTIHQAGSRSKNAELNGLLGELNLNFPDITEAFRARYTK